MQLIIFFAGIVIGVLVSEVIRRVRTGKGYFKLEKIPDEDDLYTINVRLVPYQKLNKKKHITPVAGSKVVTIIKGKNYVNLMTASEAAGLLGIANGTNAAVSLAVSNGDAHAFNARVYGAEYWNVDSSWYVYFNATASVTQPVRVNYILAPII